MAEFPQRVHRSGAMIRSLERSPQFGCLRFRGKVGLVSRAEDYPFASTAHHLLRSPRPWLRADWIEQEIVRAERQLPPRPKTPHYFLAFPRAEDPARLLWVEDRLRARRAWSDPFLDLTDFAPDPVAAWMQRKAQLADGTSPNLPSVTADDLEAHLLRARTETPLWNLPEHADERIWLCLRVALLRDLGGQSWKETGLRTSHSRSALDRAYHFHNGLLLGEPTFAFRAARIAAQLLSP